MPAAFSKSDTLAWHVTKDTPEEISYVQRQRYTFKGFGWTKVLVVRTLRPLRSFLDMLRHSRYCLLYLSHR